MRGEERAYRRYAGREACPFFGCLLLLFLCLLHGCSFKGEINQKEFALFLTEMDTRRDYSVTHAASQVKLLIAALKHESATVRYNAAQDLRGMGETSLPAVPQLIMSLSDKNNLVSSMGYRALEAIPLESAASTVQLSAEEVIFEELKKSTLRASTQKRLLKVLSRLPNIGGGRYEGLRHSLTSGSPKVRKQAILILSRSEEDIDERLLADLEDTAPRIRAGVAQILGRRNYTRAIIPLRQQLSDPAAEARWGAAIALARMKPQSKSQEVRDLIKSAHSGGYQQKECAELLLALGEGAYLNALKQERIARRSAARTAKTRSSKKNVTKAVAVVKKKLKERQKAKLKSKKNSALVRKEIVRYRLALRGGNVAKKRQVIYALKRLAPFYGSAATTLISALSNPDAAIRAEAARAIAELRMSRAVDELAIHAMEDPDQQVRRFSAGALRAIDSATAREAVKRLPQGLGKEAMPEPEEEVSPLVRCSELVALCRLALQELGDLGNVLNSNAGECAWQIQAGC